MLDGSSELCRQVFKVVSSFGQNQRTPCAFQSLIDVMQNEVISVRIVRERRIETLNRQLRTLIGQRKRSAPYQAEGESDRLEFKKRTGQRTEAAKTVCAMLNGLGGFVLFGVTDKGEVVGQLVAANTLEDIAAELRRIEPPAFPDIETVNLGKDVSVIVLNVPGGGGPYTYDGRPYLRHGPTTVIMPRHEYERRLRERLHATRRWENEPVPDSVSVKDLDRQEVLLTLDNAIRLGRLEPTDRRNLATVLRGLELIHGDKLLSAAVVLSWKERQAQATLPPDGHQACAFSRYQSLGGFL